MCEETTCTNANALSIENGSERLLRLINLFGHCADSHGLAARHRVTMSTKRLASGDADDRRSSEAGRLQNSHGRKVAYRLL